jgi:pimeloyl-ACP methyl ester carboxylesterase
MSTDRAPHHTFVLIPGAGGQASYWDWVIAILEAAGHEVVAVDLPAADPAAGIAEYVDATVEAIGDREAPILVAQSLGGFTGVGVCLRMPVAQLVFVNAMIPAPGETSGEWWSNTGQAEAMRANTVAEGRDPDKDFDLMETFFHDVPPDVTAQVMAGPEPQQTDTPFGSPSMFDRWPEVPIKVVVGRDDRLFPLDFQRRIARDRLGVSPDEVAGGHVVALSNPEGLARLLLRYAGDL